MPVVRAPSGDLAIKAVEAILEGGISTFEITLTVPGAVQVIESLVKRFASRALLGAGTVLSAEQAAACIDAGAQFIVSPGFDAATVELVLRLEATASTSSQGQASSTPLSSWAGALSTPPAPPSPPVPAA